MAKLDPAIEMLLHEVKATGFYGSVELKFEAGQLVLIRRNETIKPSNYRDQRDSEVR